ncbi:hypothetical protein B0H14DRAFT_3771705 [Mycena olivaceomarginata]|nr:hypothetical protein B0H14DRAFT_3771705 [Mycena olivaceomarginata]
MSSYPFTKLAIIRLQPQFPSVLASPANWLQHRGRDSPRSATLREEASGVTSPAICADDEDGSGRADGKRGSGRVASGVCGVGWRAVTRMDLVERGAGIGLWLGYAHAPGVPGSAVSTCERKCTRYGVSSGCGWAGAAAMTACDGSGAGARVSSYAGFPLAHPVIRNGYLDSLASTKLVRRRKGATAITGFPLVYAAECTSGSCPGSRLGDANPLSDVDDISYRQKRHKYCDAGVPK